MKAVEISICVGWEGHIHSIKTSENYPVGLLLIFRRYKERDVFFIFLCGPGNQIFFQETQLNSSFLSGFNKIPMIIWSSQKPSQNSFHICLEPFAVNFSSDMNPSVTDLQSQYTAQPDQPTGSFSPSSLQVCEFRQFCHQMALNQNRVQTDFGSYSPKP